MEADLKVVPEIRIHIFDTLRGITIAPRPNVVHALMNDYGGNRELKHIS